MSARRARERRKRMMASAGLLALAIPGAQQGATAGGRAAGAAVAGSVVTMRGTAIQFGYAQGPQQCQPTHCNDPMRAGIIIVGGMPYEIDCLMVDEQGSRATMYASGVSKKSKSDAIYVKVEGLHKLEGLSPRDPLPDPRGLLPMAGTAAIKGMDGLCGAGGVGTTLALGAATYKVQKI